MQSSIRASFVALAFLAACSESAGPPGALTPSGTAEVEIDPASGSFVVGRLEFPVEGMGPAVVELVGANLEVDAEREILALDVRLHNAGAIPLYPPAIAWLSDFLPPGVKVLNASVPLPDPVTTRWGFDYSRRLGPDDLLAPGADSEPWRWRFLDPGVEAFSFAAELEIAVEPPPAILSGGVFEDLNRNGIRERNEGPWNGGVLHLVEPDGAHRMAWCDEVGAFRFVVARPGLYRLELESLVDCPVCFTTPNPLQVLLPVGPDGEPESFGQAIFGAVCGECDPPRSGH